MTAAPRTLVAVGALLLAVWAWRGGEAHAKTPPVVDDGENGVWIGVGSAFVQQSRDRWSVFPAPSTVNELAVDENTLWVATDDGAIRFDSQSRHSTVYDMDAGLPSQAVAAVAVDAQYVWLGTNKGLARYRKLDQTFRIYTDEEGLPHHSVNDILVIGRQVWFATRGGIAVFDPELDGLRAYTSDDGLASDYVEELFQVGDDLWCLTDEGLSRFRIKTRSFANFSFDDIGGEEVRTFVLDGDRIWIGTENGLVGFETTSDTFRPFPQQSSLEGKEIVDVETFSDYLFITTDKAVVQYYKPNHSIRRFTEADGIARQAGAEFTALAGGIFTIIFSDGAETYDIQRDLWSSKSFAATQAKPSVFRVFGKLDSFVPIDLRTGKLDVDRYYGNAEIGFGAGTRFSGGRSLDASLRLDYGQIEMDEDWGLHHSGIRDLEYDAEYLGTQDDVLREARAGDKLEERMLEEGLERSLLLEGAQVRIASKGEEPKASLVVEGGRRRGAVVRDFLTGPRKDIYQLSQRYILPGTDRVYVDGELLTNGTDYTIIYPAGQLAFLDPERVDDLSIIEVEYEFDLNPKKGLGGLSLLDFLPGDREVGAWTRQGEPRLISEESGLYQQIDGAAPKYIDRGWERSVYAEYRQGSRSIRVAIHDMGSEANAALIYDYDLPPAREPVTGYENLIIDVGLANSYAAKAHTKTFYLELSIDEKSDAAKQSLKLFAIEVLDRSENAGAHDPEASREWLASVRAASSPYHGMELGARMVMLRGSETPAGEPGRKLLAGTADARYEHAMSDGARLTAYTELGGTSGGNPGDPDGWAAMGRVRLSHPFLEGTAEGRYRSDGHTAIGNDQTLLGRLRSEGRVSATAYPERWLPTTVFFTRQEALTESGGSGTVQHALVRGQLAKEKLPATSIMAGHTLVQAPGEETSRLRFVGQSDYDIPRAALHHVHLERFELRGLYGLSTATTETGGSFAHGDRVHLARLEGKLAPTTTESAYALFRMRRVEDQPVQGGEFDLGTLHWELNSGARSEIVPGLKPQVNYTVYFDDLEEDSGARTRSAKASVTAELGLYPGEYWSPLVPVVIVPRYSIANNEQSSDSLRTLWSRSQRVDNRMIYAGRRKLEVELYQLFESSREGQHQLLQARKVEARSRVVYRPIYASPITFRLDHQRLKNRNDLTVAPGAPKWGFVISNEALVEWLMRWNRNWTTRLRSGLLRSNTDSWVIEGATGAEADALSYRQYRALGETEIRYLTRDTHLFAVQRNRAHVLFGTGPGSADALVYEIAAGIIWMLGDALYLDSELAYQHSICYGGACATTRHLEPRVFFTFNL